MTVELRLRTKIQQEELDQKVGKILTDEDYNVLLTRATRVLKPDGSLLCVYRPRAFAPDTMAGFYDVLHSLKDQETTNRGLASGTERHKSMEGGTWTYSKPVASAIVGAMDPGTQRRYCRLTAWTGRHWPEYESLMPLFREIGARFAEEVPDRYAVQMNEVSQTPEDWVIEGTPFTTITVNNTYPTGVHTDRGDLAAGFSNLTVLRRGAYSGGRLVFPEFRVAVDMQDGDLLLMDAHEWHGNTFLDLQSEDAERISIVAYYRAKMKNCGTADEEVERAMQYAEHRQTITSEQLVEEMAAEAAQVVGA